MQTARVIALVEPSQSLVLDVHERFVSWRASRFNPLALVMASNALPGERQRGRASTALSANTTAMSTRVYTALPTVNG